MPETLEEIQALELEISKLVATKKFGYKLDKMSSRLLEMYARYKADNSRARPITQYNNHGDARVV